MEEEKDEDAEDSGGDLRDYEEDEGEHEDEDEEEDRE